MFVFGPGSGGLRPLTLTSLILASDVIAARRELAKRHIVLIPTTVRVNSIYFHVCCAVKAVKALDKSSQHKLNIRWGVRYKLIPQKLVGFHKN